MDSQNIAFFLPEWPHAYGGPSATVDFKSQPDDFVVEEILGFEPEGSGEHVFLFVEKVGENTEYIARLLARHAEVRQRDIGFAGLKDRHARTRQWFSVWLPATARKQEVGQCPESLPIKVDPDWLALESDHLKILRVVRHLRKLKRGVLDGNRFEITLRNWRGDREQCERQLRQIQRQGFPNYFGEQRFGHQGRNIDKALAMFQGAKFKPEQASIYLSAARSYLFNLILAERVKAQTWNKALPGDVFKLDGSNSQFVAETIDSVLNERLESGDIDPTAALWGKGGSRAGDAVLALEQGIAQTHPDLAAGLEKAGVVADRRALRARAEALDWEFAAGDVLRLRFRLPAGSYATALLREVVATEQAPPVSST